MGEDIRQRHRLNRPPAQASNHASLSKNFPYHSTKEKKSQNESQFQQLLLLIIVVYGLGMFSLVNYSTHYLPTPKQTATAKPEEFVEETARSHLKELVGLGNRIAGSVANEVDAVNYIFRSIEKINGLLQPSMKLEMNIQKPTGSFTIDFLGGFASYYSNITNIVVRLSPINSKSKHTLLLNCHTDSVAGSPGASDDGAACAVLLEVMRALAADRSAPLLHPVIFLFNGAEENILQASHGFITKHQWAKDVVAFINLEAAGAGGKEIVFQTGPKNPWLAMTWAAHAPHPFGSVVAQELFQSGVIPSDTDFRIFRDYGKIPGIDLAYMTNGYVYHTPYDNMDMINPGSIQRAGDNILSVVRHLVTSKSSMLPDPGAYRHGSTVFVDVLGAFMLILPFRLVAVLNFMCSVGGLLYIGRRIMFSIDVPAVTYGKQLIKATAVVILSWVACLCSAACVAGFVTKFGNPMSFFSMPYFVLFLYAFPGFGAMLLVHSTARRTIFKTESSWFLETVFFDAFLLIWCAVLFRLNYLELQSSFVLLLCCAPVFAIRCVVFRNFFNYQAGGYPVSKILLYLASLIPHAVFVLTHILLTMKFFIPLCGRLGTEVPPDFVIGLLTAVLVCISSHFYVSLVYLARSLRRVGLVIFVGFLVALFVALSSYGFQYKVTPASPTGKRLFLQHTSREFYDSSKKLLDSDSGLWINSMDYPAFNVDMGDGVLQKLPSVHCTGLFCHFPFGVPVHKFVKHSKYAPADKPLVPQMKKNPFVFELKDERIKLVRENATTRVFKKFLKFRVTGPSHMSIQIGTLSSSRSSSDLTNWSVSGDMNDAWTHPTTEPTVKDYSYNDWFFLYYGSGIKPVPWEPWFEFTVTQKSDLPKPGTPGSPLIAEIAFSAQYYRETNEIPVGGMTKELELFLGSLHDWVMPISWVSLYRNYLY